MSKGFTGLNPRNQAFKQFKCPVLNVLIMLHSLQIVAVFFFYLFIYWYQNNVAVLFALSEIRKIGQVFAVLGCYTA